MKILGINYGHDSGAALIFGGKLICAINEERITRKKLYTGFPLNSINVVLNEGCIQYRDLDVIAIEGKHFIPEDSHNIESGNSLKKKVINILGVEKFLLGTNLGLSILRLIFFPRTWFKQIKLKFFFYKNGFRGNIQYVDHHYCHALTAALTQPLDDGLIITLDASGEGLCSKIYTLTSGVLKFKQSVPCFHSPAYYYAHITKMLGFIPLRHEGKITGLAAHGSSKKGYEVLRDFIYYSRNNNTFINNGGYGDKVYKKLLNSFVGYSKEDIASSIQHYVEDIVCQYINNSIKRYCHGSSSNIFLSGGFFANVKVNQRIGQLPSVNKLFVFPNMGDGGISLGAALSIERKKILIEDYYLGPNNDFNQELNGMDLPNHIRERACSNLSEEIASILSRGKIVALCVGRMEFGPRALGNRSILYEAGNVTINDVLNSKLGRTEFMPFAPVVRDVDALDFFKLKNQCCESYQFMTQTCDVTDKCKAEAPAIVHVDGTARPQVISRGSNQLYYDILTDYKRISGKSILVNTSFNMHEEPIIYSIGDALNTFLASEIDYLVLGDKLFESNLIHNHGQTM